MKYIKQLFIILVISFVGEALKYLIPLPIPASIYGMVLMFVALCTGAIKLSTVKESGKFLVEIMPIMFIAPAVGLISAWDQLREFLVPLTVITVVSTIIVMVVAGRVTQRVIRESKKTSA